MTQLLGRAVSLTLSVTLALSLILSPRLALTLTLALEAMPGFQRTTLEYAQGSS